MSAEVSEGTLLPERVCRSWQAIDAFIQRNARLRVGVVIQLIRKRETEGCCHRRAAEEDCKFDLGLGLAG